MSNNYQLSHAELVRLARTPPAQRGEQVRVLQQSGIHEDQLEPDEPVDPEDDPFASTQTSVHVDLSGQGSGPGQRFDPHGGGGLASGGAGLSHIPAMPGHVAHTPASPGGSVHVRGQSGSSGGSGGSGGGGGGGAGEAIVLAVVAAAAAGTIAVCAAVIEGRRFDGWAVVEADQPVVLVSASGSHWVPLSLLSERDAASAEYGFIPERSASVHRLARAPLARTGFAYEFEMGSARLNTVTGLGHFGFASRMGFGYFPWQTLGVLGGGQVAFGDARADNGHGPVFNGRLFAELEYLPIHTRRFHVGVYTELGESWALQDVADSTPGWAGPYASAGVLAQFDWTTRLALDLRAGLAALPGYRENRVYTPELTLGISVY